MKSYAVLLRAINVGRHNRIAMSELRSELSGAGFNEVTTYLQTGNIRLESRTDAARIRDQIETLLVERGLRNASVAVLEWSRLEDLATQGFFNPEAPADTRKLAIFPRDRFTDPGSLLGSRGPLKIVEAEPDVLIGSIRRGETAAFDLTKLIDRPLGTTTTARFCNVIADWVSRG